MGKATADGFDQAVTVGEASLAALNAATPWRAFEGLFNFDLAGTFVATIVIERSFDGGVTARPCTAQGQPVSFTAPASEALQAGEEGVLYRARVSAYTSGAAQARLSQ